VRLFEHVVGKLAQGEQPDAELVESVGYLMRTTAVYGSGKFGAADRDVIAARPECAAPFQIEMLSVFLTRAFVMDLVEHLAKMRSPETATTLEPKLRRRFGIGNSTGLGMAPFLLTHPMLLNNWIAAREEALARVRAVMRPTDDEVAIFRDRLSRAVTNAAIWRSEHPLQIEKLTALRADLATLVEYVDGFTFRDSPWNQLYNWAESALSVEGQEQLVSLMLEPYPDLVDGLADCLSADESIGTRIDGKMAIGALKKLTREFYGWTRGIDWTSKGAQARAWYVSEEKLEPRLGERFEEPIADYEQPLSPGRDAALMMADLAQEDEDGLTAQFLLRHPEHRHMVRRLQLLDRCPYGEIRDNTICETLLPIDMLRCKLSFFGAGHFDPRSDRWVRINMFQGAPFPHEISETGDDWMYP